MTPLARILYGWVLVLLAAAPLAAQVPADTALTQLLQEARARKWVMRAGADSSFISQGELKAFTDSTLTIGDQQLRLAEISLLDRRVTNRKILGGGALVGGLAGAVLGAGLIGLACSYQPDCGGDTIFLIGGALTASGAAIGGVFGGLLGGYEWRTVWQRP